MNYCTEYKFVYKIGLGLPQACTLARLATSAGASDLMRLCERQNVGRGSLPGGGLLGLRRLKSRLKTTISILN